MAALYDITPATEIKDASGYDWSWAFVWFKQVPDFPFYVAGTNGSVWGSHGSNGKTKGIRWCRLGVFVRPDGRHCLSLYRNGVRYQRFVHRVILDTFVGSCPPGMEACHFPDRDPSNNWLSNLRWGTKKANSHDSYLHGTRATGDRHGQTKLSESDVTDIRSALGEGVRQSYLARWYSVSPALISIIASGKHRMPEPQPIAQETGVSHGPWW
jgi:HNH endonuclease